MNLAEIEQNLAALGVPQGFDLVYDLLRAYGIPKASISHLRRDERQIRIETEAL